MAKKPTTKENEVQEPVKDTEAEAKAKAASQAKAAAEAAKKAEAEAKKAAAEAEKARKAEERKQAAEAKKAAAAEAKAKAAAEREARKAEREAEKARKLEEKEKNRMPEKNGVRRPKPETMCGKVWAIADSISEKTGAPAPIASILEEGLKQGLNEGNMKTEYARWRKFYGITGRHTLPKEEAKPSA